MKVEDIGKDLSEKLKVEEVDSEVEKKIEKVCWSTILSFNYQLVSDTGKRR